MSWRPPVNDGKQFRFLYSTFMGLKSVNDGHFFCIPLILVTAIRRFTLHEYSNKHVFLVYFSK